MIFWDFVVYILAFGVFKSVMGASLPPEAIDPSSGKIVTPDELEFLHGDPPITHKVNFQIIKLWVNEEENRVIKEDLGTISLGLFGMTVPKTVYNFLELSNMTLGFGYKNVAFHRIIKNFMIQGGDFQNYNTDPNRDISNKPHVKSIYGEKFDDENFKLSHNKFGRLSMANAGPNTNGGQFFITTKDSCDWLNGHHVVFGQLIRGDAVLNTLNQVETDSHDKPIKDYIIGKVEITTLFDIKPLLLEKNIDVIENTPALGTSNYNIETVNPPTNNYKFLIIFILLVMVVWILNRVYLRRQYVTDIKDSNYF